MSGSDAGTFGTIHLPGQPRFFSLELPWKDNHPFLSCVPTGIYPAEMAWSAHFGRNLYHLLDVPDRDAIEVHVANWASELRGCIALGRKIAQWPKKGWGVANSASALDLFTHALHGQPFRFDIRQWRQAA